MTKLRKVDPLQKNTIEAFACYVRCWCAGTCGSNCGPTNSPDYYFSYANIDLPAEAGNGNPIQWDLSNLPYASK